METMRVLRGLQALKRPPQRAVVTVGMFDGVHVAHQRLIQTTVQLAHRIRGTSVVITFDPDPQQVLDPQHAPGRLLSIETRVRLMEAFGVDLVWIIPFTKAFSRTAPERFVRRILLQRLRASCVVVGETFGFGRDRRGNLRLLQGLGQQHQMRVVVVSPVRRGGALVSSSRIRQLIEMGKLAHARRLLGRPVELFGTVVRGEGRARRLGFPTANVQLMDGAMPPRGVYRVWVCLEGGRPSRSEQPRRGVPGLMNLGLRPTFGPGPLVCEVHLVGFRGTLYRRKVAIALVKRLRGERRFDSPEALVRQIKRDLAHARLVSQPS